MTLPLPETGPRHLWIREIRWSVDSLESSLIRPSTAFIRQARRLAQKKSVMAGVLFAFSLHCTRPPVSGPVTRREGRSRTQPVEAYSEEGFASWYGGGDGFAGKPTASGEIFDPEQLTCAHRTLPLGTRLEVENLGNGKRVVVRVNDRGPFTRGRILDLSKRAAKDLDFLGHGTARIRIRSVDAGGSPAAVDESLAQGDPFTLQVGSFSDPANVDRLVQELEPEFGPVTLRASQSREGRSLQRVLVGRFLRREEAEEALRKLNRKLKDRGVEPLLTRLR